jgi:hypothetical protein
MRSIYIYVFLLLFATGSGCKKFITATPPVTSLSGSSIYTSDATAISVLTGIYTKISKSGVGIGTLPSLSLYAGLSADELTPWSGLSSNASVMAYYQDKLSASFGYGSEFWTNLYSYIFSCNAAIGGLSGSTLLAPSTKQQLMGEAKFMRALSYFYLVNLYGDVAMPLDTNYVKNKVLSRIPASQVYQQIIADLRDAELLLSPNYLDASLMHNISDRIRPTLWAATALLARTYLYNGNWSGADSAASVVLSNSSLFGLAGLDSAFLRSGTSQNTATVNKEAIWQLQSVTNNPANTYDALAFIIPSSGLGSAGSFGVYMNSSLLAGFEPGDKRMTRWIGKITIGGNVYYYPFKYKVNSRSTTVAITEYLMMLRLGEQYLIRAEARAEEGNISGAQSDLNVIRARAGLPPTAASTMPDLLSAILRERRSELFTELGQRWLDLKRTATVDATMSVIAPQKGGAGSTWNSYQQLYPIRNADIQLDPNLKQNAGY